MVVYCNGTMEVWISVRLDERSPGVTGVEKERRQETDEEVSWARGTWFLIFRPGLPTANERG